MGSMIIEKAKPGLAGRFIVIGLVVILMLVWPAAGANQPPVADADPDYQEEYVGYPVYFTGVNSSDPDGWIVYYTWDFGDGHYDFGNNSSTSHVYDTPGYYRVNLTVWDNEYYPDNDTVYVNIFQSPGGNITPYIHVYSPGGTPGEMYEQGDLIEILWYAYDDDPLPPNPINISYTTSPTPPGGLIRIASHEENDGIYLWDTTNVTCPGAYYMHLTVYDIDGNESFDYSDYHFYLMCPSDQLPYIEVIEPGDTPGQVYYEGDIITVLWDANDDNPLPPNPINISYGDTTSGWTTIALGEANDGIYDWDTTGVPWGTYWVKVSVYDSGGHEVFDLSNHSFEITCSDCPPEAPELLSAVLTGSSNEDVTIEWALSGDDGAGEDDVVTYEVYYATSYAKDGSGYALLATLVPGTSTYVHAGAGDGDPNNYFYFVQVVDGIGQTGWDGQAGKYVRALEGNLKELVSIPLVQADTDIQEVLKTVAGSYDIVRYYKSSDQADHWKSFHAWKPSVSNDLYYIDHTMAVWIKMLADDELVVAGLVPETTQIELSPAWNLIGYPCFTPDTVGSVLSSISYTNVQGWGDTRPHHQIQLYDTDMMSDGNGYWIRVHSPQVLTISN